MVSGESEPRKGQVPTLGIWSSGDTYLWEDQIKTSGALMDADWRYERIEGGSHWVMLDRAQEVNALILDWLEKTSINKYGASSEQRHFFSGDRIRIISGSSRRKKMSALVNDPQSLAEHLRCARYKTTRSAGQI